MENEQHKSIILKLYIAGTTEKSQAEAERLQEVCENHFPGKYKIEVIDLLERPQLASDEQIFAVPTLVRDLPLPVRKVIGDFSNVEKALVGLDLLPRSH
ncbi:MAG: hypothetical protein K9I94_01715 [Bacteroidales bacterium]|nr:hypothetical protein [Bacteroidales bacterium]